LVDLTLPVLDWIPVRTPDLEEEMRRAVVPDWQLCDGISRVWVVGLAGAHY
jgi:hypothetical protein